MDLLKSLQINPTTFQRQQNRANDLDIYEYLKHLLTEMPNNHYQEEPSVIDQLLSWSNELPEQYHLKKKQKSASNNDVNNIARTLPLYTTPCFEALTNSHTLSCTCKPTYKTQIILQHKRLIRFLKVTHIHTSAFCCVRDTQNTVLY